MGAGHSKQCGEVLPEQHFARTGSKRNGCESEQRRSGLTPILRTGTVQKTAHAHPIGDVSQEPRHQAGAPRPRVGIQPPAPAPDPDGADGADATLHRRDRLRLPPPLPRERARCRSVRARGRIAPRPLPRQPARRCRISPHEATVRRTLCPHGGSDVDGPVLHTVECAHRLQWRVASRRRSEGKSWTTHSCPGKAIT